MKNKTQILILIIMISIISPMLNPSQLVQENRDLEDATKGRAVEPDVNITTLDWIGPSYVCMLCGSIPTLAETTQSIRAAVSNDGLATASGILSFFVDNADGSGFVLVSTQSINMAPGAVNQHIFNWGAVSGSNQKVRLFATIMGDSDGSNNILELDYDVQDTNLGEVYSDTLPADGTRLPHQNAVASLGVRNAGNLDVGAVANISLTPHSGGDVVYISSSVKTLLSGSIYSPAPVEIISVLIEGANLSGNYDLGGLVYFNSTSPVLSVTESITSRVVTFSQYRASIVSPSDRAVEPGQSTTMTFMIQNIGELPDRYNITITDTKGWSNSTTLPPQTSIINASSSEAIIVPVMVPFGTNRSESDIITLEIESEAESYILQSSSTVMAGDILQGTLNRSNWNVPVIPGTDLDIQYTLKNTGTSPSVFNLSIGFQQLAPGWAVTINPSTTPYMTVNEEIIVVATVSPPSLTMPFDPTTKLAEGNQLFLWTSINPVGAGAPNVQQTILDVQPTIMVELLTTENNISINESEISSGQITRFIDIDMQLRHNLISNLSSSVDVNLNISPIGFTPSKFGTGLNEIQRWNSSITPNNISIILGATESHVATILGPIDLLPLAGIMRFDVVANLTLSGALSGGIEAPNTTLEIIFDISEYAAVSVETPPVTTVIPEIETPMNLNITNIGNYRSDFTFSASGPDNWTITTSPNYVNNLGSPIDNWPSIGNDNTSLIVYVTAPQNARADSTPEVILTVFDEHGKTISQTIIQIFVQEVINGFLDPDYALAVIPISSTGTIVLKAHNSGNSMQEFSVDVEHNFTDINMTIISNDTFPIEPGHYSDIIIEVTSGPFAKADQNHTAQIILYHNIDEKSRIDAYVEILPNHHIEFEHREEFSVVPGMNISILVNATNVGNLNELINFTTELPNGWSAIVRPQNMTINANESEIWQIIVDVTVPPMSPGLGLEAGETHDLTLFATNVTDNILSGITIIKFNIEPIFVLSSEDFPNLVELLPGENKTFEIIVSNDGNHNVTLDVECQLTTPARWIVSNCETTNYTLDSGNTSLFSFTVQSIAPNHYNGEVADLSIIFSPQDNFSGDAMLMTKLRITRIHTYIPLELSGGQRVHDISIDWMHVQSLGQTADSRAISYELNITNMTRYVDEELYQENIDWGFWIDYGNGFVSLDDSPFTMDPVSPLTLQTIILRLELPETSYIPPGDGWSIILHLTNLDDLSNTTSNLDIQVDAWADPSVISLTLDGLTSIIESNDGTMTATIENTGNAGTALGVVATLHCDDSILILDEPTKAIISLSPFESRELNWSVQSKALDWWTSETIASCEVLIESPFMEGDDESNDKLTNQISIQSWSLPLLMLIPISILLIGISFRLLQKAPEDERSLMLSAYSGSVMLGIAIHYNLGEIVNFTLAIISLLWILLITSRSTNFEIPPLLSDYKNKQRGYDSVIENHEEELNKVVNQLRMKLSFAPLGFLFMALVMPSDISWSVFNIGFVLLYSLLGVIIVFTTINFNQNTWSRIFENMEILEHETEELLQHLGAPSTDLRRITIGQRWGESHSVNIEVDENV